MYSEIELIGNLSTEPELRYTPAGNAVCHFNMATNREWEDKKETTWYRISVWGKSGEACAQWLHKGRQVFVKGRLVCDPATGGPRVYQKSDGTWAASFEISAATVKFLGGKNGNVETEVDAGTAEQVDTKDIPF